jgi:hypothetical protein
VRNSPFMPAALAALLMAAGALAAEAPAAPAAAPGPAPAAAAPNAPQQPGIRVSSPESRLELRLPAAYWEALTPQEIARHMQGGCGQGQVPASLLYLVQDRDALVQIVISRSDRTFLMRDKGDLEAFENGFMKAVQDQLGGAAADVESSYEERDGMIVHRFGLTATPSSGGGCAAAGGQGGPPQKLHFLFVDYFVHPEGEDALYYRATARAPVETFTDVQPEVDFIVRSVRFTGKLAGSFFTPDAPADKVPTAKEAAKGVGGHGLGSGWMLAVALVVAVWLMMRRRKQPQP